MVDQSICCECQVNALTKEVNFFHFRIVNLELLSKFGPDAWRSHNEVLQQMLDDQQRQLNVLRCVESFSGYKFCLLFSLS